MHRVRNVKGTIPTAMAQGTTPDSIALVTEREIQRWQDILNDPEAERAKQVQSARAAKHEVSDDRKATWTNTIEGSRTTKLERRTQRLEEEEARRREIDKLEADHRATVHETQVEEANKQLYARDERVRNALSQVLLHNVLQERDQQVQLSARRQAIAQQREREFAEVIKRNAVKEAEESVERVRTARKEAQELQSVRLSQLHNAIDARRTEVAQGKVEGQQIRALAEADAKKAEEEKLAARQRARELEKFRLEQMSQRKQGEPEPVNPLSPSEVKYLTLKAQQTRELQQRHEARITRLDGARQAVADLHISLPPKREEAIETIASARSLWNRMLEDDVARTHSMEDHKTHLFETYNRQVSRREQQKQNEAAHTHRQAEALNQQIAILERESELEKLQARLQAQELQDLLRMQAREKQTQVQIEKESGVEERRNQELAIQAENAMFRRYIESMLPENLSAPLRTKAIQSPRAPLVV